MQAGDIVLVSRGNGILDKLVQWATVSPFYHAAIALNESAPVTVTIPELTLAGTITSA